MEASAASSGVVEGDAEERRYPQNIFGNAVPPNDIRTRGNGDTVAFPQVGLQRNAKLILMKITKIVATRCHILKQKCTKLDFG